MKATKRELELALKGLAVERAKIDKETAEIENLLDPKPQPLGASTVETVEMEPIKPKRTMSAEARKKISRAMRKLHRMRKEHM